MLTIIEGDSNGGSTAAVAIREHAELGLLCDVRHDQELVYVRTALSQIVAIGHPDASNLGRVALVHLTRAEEHDRNEDEHFRMVLQLNAVVHRAFRAIAGAVERLLVGRSRVNGDQS